MQQPREFNKTLVNCLCFHLSSHDTGRQEWLVTRNQWKHGQFFGMKMIINNQIIVLEVNRKNWNMSIRMQPDRISH